jgi:D-3-phosphoglycerate dehydrogenase
MDDPVVEYLILELLGWIASPGERPYDEVLRAWRTSCPRLPVWEEATDRGLLETTVVEGREVVRITEPGREHLRRRHRAGLRP